MKKTLLSFLFFFFFFFAQSQVIINELYTDAGQQYFELYNTGNAAQNLNCFTVVSYYDFTTTEGGSAVRHTGFYLLDLPNFSLAPRAYYTAAGTGTISVGTTTVTPNLNWNSGTQALFEQDGYLKKYERNGNGYTATDVTGIDFLATHNGNYSLFVFNQGFYTNGFVSGLSSPSTTASPFYLMPQMSNLRNPCHTYTLNWMNVATAEYHPNTPGSHGFYRGANGLCGTWASLADADLATAAVSPGVQNPVGTITNPQGGTLTAVQDKCTEAIRFTINQTADPSTLPVRVELYYDNGTIGTLDNSDRIRPGTAMIMETPGSGTFDIVGARASQKFLVVYRSYTLGCISAVAAPTTVSGTLTTNQSVQKINSGSRALYPAAVHINVSAITTATPLPSLLPIEARLYIDNDPGNNTISDTVYLGSKYFTQVSDGGQVSDGEQVFDAADQLLNSGDGGKRIYIVYKTPAACIASSVSFDLASEAPLPVTFINFTATRTGDNVGLVWQTASEQGNKGFYIQRNLNGRWVTVGFVPSAATAGNSTSNLAYNLTDLNPTTKVTLYRILQMDLNGTAHYSITRAVVGTAGVGRMLLFPNPSPTGAATLLFESDGQRHVAVTDVAGRIVKQYRNVTARSLALSGLPNGFYTVQVLNLSNGKNTVEKLIVQKP